MEFMFSFIRQLGGAIGWSRPRILPLWRSWSLQESDNCHHAHICTETHTHAQRHTCTETHMQRHTRRNTCTETHTQEHMHRDTCTETHTQKHMHRDTDVETHMHTSASSLRLCKDWLLSAVGSEGWMDRVSGLCFKTVQGEYIVCSFFPA